MSTVIIVTNFSSASQNALDYAGEFLQNSTTTRLLLLNIYAFPGTITVDAIAVAAMREIIERDSARLQQEYERVHARYPTLPIDTEMVTGVFRDELQQKIVETDAVLVIMGAHGNYSDLLSWDVNIINAFIDLQVPVMVIPAQVQFRPIHKIAFACNYYRKNLQVPITMIRKLVLFTRADLFVINVVSPQDVITEEGLQNRQELQSGLADLTPVYYEPAFDNVIAAIDNFISAENIDILLVIPTRHGIWANIFQKTHTKELVYLNQIPVLSLRQQEEFIH